MSCRHAVANEQLKVKATVDVDIGDMDQTQQRAQQFRRLWATALAQYNKETRLNIEDPAIPHPRNVDELIVSLKSQHAEFRDDTRSNAFTDVIKGAIGPFNFLSNSVGSTVAPVRSEGNSG